MLHKPVLLQEVLSHLCLKSGAVVIDGTLGSGGHSQRILESIGPSGKLIGIDRDLAAIERATQRLHSYLPQCRLVHGNFSDIRSILQSLNIKRVHAVLLDIGVSLDQLTEAGRGFSFRSNGPLDMRMDQSSGRTAEELVNRLPEKELSDLFWLYGEERHSRRIARKIVERRKQQRISTTKQLAEIVSQCVRAGASRIHPATRVFQALRIEVNQELEHLKLAIGELIDVLEVGGRFVIITFHSLEDRIVKRAFLAASTEGTIKLVHRKPIQPSSGELRENPQSRSAKMRVVEKC